MARWHPGETPLTCCGEPRCCWGSMGYGGVCWDSVWRLWPALLISAGLVRLLRDLGSD